MKFAVGHIWKHRNCPHIRPAFDAWARAPNEEERIQCLLKLAQAFTERGAEQGKDYECADYLMRVAGCLLLQPVVTAQAELTRKREDQGVKYGRRSLFSFERWN